MFCRKIVVSRLFAAGMALVAFSHAPLIHAQKAPAEDPPQMSEVMPRTEDNRKLFRWDRPSAFGDVPAGLQPIGDFICAKGRIDLHAIGFHPRAKDKDGQEIPGGGYLCERKDTGDRPHPVPPRLTSVNAVVGWDRPSAFGAVPTSLLVPGRQRCQDMGSNLDAIGFHPQAQDDLGRLIPGGGYLCGPALQP